MRRAAIRKDSAEKDCAADGRRSRVRGALLGLAVALPLVLGGTASHADEYDADRAGHPLRIAAYIAHPVGVVLDYLIFRPAHWLGSKEPLRTLFGHEES